jgi:hypothetical protein
MLAATLGFVAGAISGGIIGVLLGAIVADTLSSRRRRRRRTEIDIYGSDALESWLAAEWPWRRTNGSPFPEGDEVA